MYTVPNTPNMKKTVTILLFERNVFLERYIFARPFESNDDES